MKCNTIVRVDGKTYVGAVVYDCGTVSLHKKSMLVEFAFGWIGSALSTGKSICSFKPDAVRAYREITEGKQLWIELDLADGKTVAMQFVQKLENELMPLLKEAAEKNARPKRFAKFIGRVAKDVLAECEARAEDSRALGDYLGQGLMQRKLTIPDANAILAEAGALKA